MSVIYEALDGSWGLHLGPSACQAHALARMLGQVPLPAFLVQVSQVEGDVMGKTPA